MLIISIIFLLLSTALSSVGSNFHLRRDKSILYNRVSIIILQIASFLSWSSLYFEPLDNGIALYGGLFHTTCTTQIFEIFLFLITAAILQLTSFYPRQRVNQLYSFVRICESLESRLLQNPSLYNSQPSPRWSLWGKGRQLPPGKLSQNKNGGGRRSFASSQFQISPPLPKLEYPLILLLIVCGAIFLLSSSDLVSIFLSVELQSYGLYILSTLYRNSEYATSGGLTYFLLGGLSSCFILLGSSLLYAITGTTNLENLYIISSLSDLASQSKWLGGTVIDLSLVIFSVGLLFKISAAPFHFWSPDVYDKIPTIVTTFVSTVAKISILIFLLELVHYTSDSFFAHQQESFTLSRASGGASPLPPPSKIDEAKVEALLQQPLFSWTYCLLISAFLSLIIGTVQGLTELRIKRLLAFSSISHLGFLLLGLSINSIESIQAFIFYLIQYSLSNLNAFIIILSIGYSLYFYVESANSGCEEGDNDEDPRFLYIGESLGEGDNVLPLWGRPINSSPFFFKKKIPPRSNNNSEYRKLNDKKNSPIQLISQIKGYFYINEYLALSFAITLFSFAGIPPLVGFFAKLMILSAALDSGLVFLSLVAIFTSVIGAVYYLAIIKQVFLDNSEYKFNKLTPHLVDESDQFSWQLGKNIALSNYLAITISFLTLILILFILKPDVGLSLANIIALIQWNT